MAFNRGALLNIGFRMAQEGGLDDDDVLVFHDIDLIPDDDLLRQYADPPPIHFASVWEHHGVEGVPQSCLGGCLSLTAGQFKKIGGYPNDYPGWGYEDDELAARLEHAGIEVRAATEGCLRDLKSVGSGAEKMAKKKDTEGGYCSNWKEVHRGHQVDRRERRTPRGVGDIDPLYRLVAATKITEQVLYQKIRFRLPQTSSLRIPLAHYGGCDPHYPHRDEYQEKLESAIQPDVVKFGRRHWLTHYNRMRAVAFNHVKYRRSCIFVEGTPEGLNVVYPDETKGDWGRHKPDARIPAYIHMLKDLARWCARYRANFFALGFVIYVTDTYAWEDFARDLPWMVMARPKNRRGVLIPDNSYLTHTEKGNTAPLVDGGEWQWDLLASRAKLAEPPPTKVDLAYFKGANTGADKYAIRKCLARGKSPSIEVDVGRSPKTSIFGWNKYRALLNLPGHQPWSYRRKYLFLQKSPVLNVDVEVEYYGGIHTQRWVQFLDHMYFDQVDFVRVVAQYRDGARRQENEKEVRRVGGALESEFQLLTDEKSARLSASAFDKTVSLTGSRILQYLYRLLLIYQIHFG